MLWYEYFADKEDDDVQHSRYGEGDIDGDIEDATEAVHGLMIILKSRDHHCQDYGDSIAGEREKEALKVRGFNM